MELRHLRYFVAVAEHLHFGRAAAELQIAQPSLSHQVRQLEDELQISLLERNKRRVRLTDAGRVFLEEAREILAHADRATLAARRASLGQVGRLRVGFAYWMDFATLVRMTKRFQEYQPGIHVELRSLSVPLQVAALHDQQIDVAFVRPPVGDRLFKSKTVLAEPFVVALADSHRLAARRRIRLSALANESFILFPRDAVPRFYDLSLKACHDAGFVPHVRTEADQPQMLLALVAASAGIALVPASAGAVPYPGVAYRALRPSTRTLETAVAWRRDIESPVVEAFVRAVQQVVGARPTRSPVGH